MKSFAFPLGLLLCFALVGCDSLDPDDSTNFQAQITVLRADGSAERTVTWEGRSALFQDLLNENATQASFAFLLNGEADSYAGVVSFRREVMGTNLTPIRPAEAGFAVGTEGGFDASISAPLPVQICTPVASVKCPAPEWVYVADGGSLRVTESKHAFIAGTFEFTARLSDESTERPFGEVLVIEGSFRSENEAFSDR
jgi:hypothetical protein